jgi:response regulator RpfG family c-di-GMP phosphodiesterase
MSEKILCVDDEPLVLDGLKRCLHERFCIDTATSADAALNLIDTQGPYAVVVSDLRMPGTDGIRFLAMVRQRAPDSVRVMLTGQADFETAIAAVNEGNIFRFLCKPYQGDALVKALTAAHEQYQLVTAERDLLEQTLSGSVRVLTDVLSLVSPAAFGRAQRVRRMVEQMCAQMQIASSWHIQVAAMLSQVGLMALPPEVVEKVHRGQPLSDAEQRMLAEHPEIGRDLVGNIPRLQEVADIIACPTLASLALTIIVAPPFANAVRMAYCVRKRAMLFSRNGTR